MSDGEKKSNSSDGPAQGPLEKKDRGTTQLRRIKPGAGTFVSMDRPVPPKPKGKRDG